MPLTIVSCLQLHLCKASALSSVIFPARDSYQALATTAQWPEHPRALPWLLLCVSLSQHLHCPFDAAATNEAPHSVVLDSHLEPWLAPFEVVLTTICGGWRFSSSI